MPGLLFVYGTLRDPELLSAVLGRPLAAAAMLAAAAPGHATVHYPGRIYPALVRRPGHGAAGLVLTDLTPFELDLLDAFEGSEYRRGIIPVIIGEELHEVFAYLPVAPIAADAPAWTLRDWQEDHKGRVLAGERATAQELRAKLIAIRPN
jgi:gamma-glutamylcyclotransferase (GGCT)/AIG2-like uncharacterized protein YtfP